jgi:hypothetical protein
MKSSCEKCLIKYVNIAGGVYCIYVFICRYYTEQGLDTTALKQRLAEVTDEEKRTANLT